ncbi:ParA family protein [Pediococcus ethanolidurans]
MTTSITIGNFKGGVGKTTTCVTFSYLLNKAHRKRQIARNNLNEFNDVN